MDKRIPHTHDDGTVHVHEGDEPGQTHEHEHFDGTVHTHEHSHAGGDHDYDHTHDEEQAPGKR